MTDEVAVIEHYWSGRGERESGGTKLGREGGLITTRRRKGGVPPWVNKGGSLS